MLEPSDVSQATNTESKLNEVLIMLSNQVDKIEYLPEELTNKFDSILQPSIPKDETPGDSEDPITESASVIVKTIQSITQRLQKAHYAIGEIITRAEV